MSNIHDVGVHSNAETMARALGGHRAGSGWLAFCPAHPNEQTPALSLSDKGGAVLVHCHAGCCQEAVLEALKARGLWSGTSSFTPDPAAIAARAEAERKERRRKLDIVRNVWRSCGPITGTLAEAYLRNRGITVPLPRSLRFSPGLKHATGAVLPCMVAAVVDAAGNFTGLHRTFLAPDGTGKAKVEPAKAMLGPCSRASVHLGDWREGEVLLLSEGIETGLSGMQLSGNPCWAALSTSGLKSIVLPAAIKSVTVLVDADPPGEAAAQSLAQRLSLEGRNVKLARPPAGYGDWNDFLQSREVA